VGRPAAADAWTAYVAFADVAFEVPDEPDADGLLYQYGVYDFSGESRFHLGLVRQFALFDDDELMQFHCNLQFAATPELRALGRYDEWWFLDEGAPAVWFERIRARPEWPLLTAQLPIAVDIDCEGT
jgi:hypothetical protein